MGYFGFCQKSGCLLRNLSVPAHLSPITVAIADQPYWHESLIDLLTASEDLALCLTPVRSSKKMCMGQMNFLVVNGFWTKLWCANSPQIYIVFFFLPFIFISWRLITLQYCSGFSHTLTWISYGFTCIPHPDRPSRLPPHPIVFKRTPSRQKRQSMKWDKIFANHICDKRLISRIYKEFLQLNNKTQFLKWVEYLNRYILSKYLLCLQGYYISICWMRGWKEQ